MNDPQDLRCQVVLIVANHSITGELGLGEARLSDYLNDVRNSFVELHNAAFARLADPGKVIHQTAKATIPKSRVVIAFEREPGRVAKTRFYAYRKKYMFPVFMGLDHMEVRGCLHATSTEAVPDLTAMREERFIPVTQAVVTFCDIDAYSIQRDSVMVHIGEIVYFSVGEPVKNGDAPAQPG